jgi:hypothetical protein
MRLLLKLLALWTLAACSPADNAKQDWRTGAIASTCTASATQRWTPLSGVYFTVEAQSFGPGCENAVAAIAVRYAEQQLLYTEAFPAAHIAPLSGARDAVTMQTALADWINPETNVMQRTGDLPDWPQGADAPSGGEFPFIVEAGWDREAYLAQRAANAPMFCFVQGMESLACLVRRNERMEKIGVQAFPG